MSCILFYLILISAMWKYSHFCQCERSQWEHNLVSTTSPKDSQQKNRVVAHYQNELKTSIRDDWYDFYSKYIIHELSFLSIIQELVIRIIVIMCVIYCWYVNPCTHFLF